MWNKKNQNEVDEEIEEQEREVKRGRPSKQEEEDRPEKKQVEVIEREVTLSLINDKLNYIISHIPKD